MRPSLNIVRHWISKETPAMSRLFAAALALTFGAWPAASSAQVVEYYHLDALGSVRAVTNQSGQVIERHDYLPFGEECLTGPCASNLQGSNTRKFTGKERDNETGLDYFGARYYGSKIGRFTTVDPYLDQSAALVDPQRWNRYAYVSNNPLRYVDPDGREQAVIVGDKTYMGGVDGMSAGNEQARDQVFNVLVTTVGVVAAAGSGFAAGGARQAAKEVLQEAVENVTGLPLGGLRGSPKGMSKTATGMADDLSGRIGKNSVPFETPSTKGHIDLRGKAHFDKATGQEIPTPHVQTRPKHVGPQGQVNLGPQTTRPATKADIRTAEKLVERRKP